MTSSGTKKAANDLLIFLRNQGVEFCGVADINELYYFFYHDTYGKIIRFSPAETMEEIVSQIMTSKIRRQSKTAHKIYKALENFAAIA